MRFLMATEPGRRDEPNEDFVAATPNAFVLVDGAGAGGLDTGCHHGVAWYSRRLGAELVALLHDQSTHLADLLAEAITNTAAGHQGCDLDNPATPSATVVIGRWSTTHFDYLVLADSVLLLTNTNGEVFEVVDDRAERITAGLRSRMDSLPAGTVEHDAAKDSLLTSLLAYRNQPGGFWVAATDAAAAGQAIVGQRPTSALMSAVALTDGATRLVDRFNQSTWGELVRRIMSDGPDAAIADVRATERSDPRGRRWPRGKKHDDASIVLVEWHNPWISAPPSTPSALRRSSATMRARFS